MKKFWIYSLSIIISTVSLHSQEMKLCKHFPPQFKQAFELQQKGLTDDRKLNVSYYRLEVVIDPEENYIEGDVTCYFRSTDSLREVVFDLSNHLQVDSVFFQNRLQSSYIHIDNILKIKLDSPLCADKKDSVRIQYSGIPQSKGFGSFVQDSYNNQDSIIWTLSQPYGAMEWWPCQNNLYDKADSVELIISTPLSFLAASNGLLKKVDTLGNQHRFHWKSNYPIAAYLVAVSVTNYKLSEEHYQLGNDSLLMQHFMYPNDTANLDRSKSATLPFLQLFDSLFGPYPFIKEKYGHASFTFGGGMEHQTLSFIGSYGGELMAHELAHQWFGNKVTCGSWQDLWLNEGFATYLTMLTYELGVVHDPFYYSVFLENIRQAAFNHPKQSVFRYDTSTVDTLFNQLTYQKGAASIHMLRWLVGDSAFFQGLQNYLNDTALAYGFAKTKDLQRHLEQSSGLRLSEFFKDWIYGKGYPTYTLNWKQSNGQLQIDVLQSQSDPSVYFFNMPIPIQLKGANIDSTLIINPRFSGDRFSININQTIDSLLFDPQKWILAKSDVISSIKNNSSESIQLTLYPNPTKNQLNIDLSYPTRFKHIQITDLKGKVVLAQNFSRQLDVSTLASGKYFLHLINNEEQYVRSFIRIRD